MRPTRCPQAAEHVGFPAVIKPIHGAASLGVLRVDSKESLAAAYEKVGWWGVQQELQRGSLWQLGRVSRRLHSCWAANAGMTAPPPGRARAGVQRAGGDHH